MPRSPESFGSGLPRVAEVKPSAAASGAKTPEHPRQQTPEENAQRMWNVYQDIKTAWVEFARARRKSGKEAPLLQPLDSDDPFSESFRATEKFQMLHAKLRTLWSDPEVRKTWEKKMRESSEQWAQVNGSWEDYEKVHKKIQELEERYDHLQKEKFDERAKSARSRRRTLDDDIVDIEIALAAERRAAEVYRAKSPELAAKILAQELAERSREWRSKNRFMWTRSMRETLEKIENIINASETLRMIVLEGEAGTGKTSLVQALSRLFTGRDALTVVVKSRTKAGRELISDQTLEPSGSPTVHQVVLQALTGKERPTDPAPQHSGYVAFIEELNRMANDEAGELATVLDSIRVGSATGYSGMGANPEDRVQPNALTMAAQNPAGGRFRDRTDFTPEVKRKLTIVPLDYPPQTSEDPELYESFLAVMKNNDGNIVADPTEMAPEWTDPQLRSDNTRQTQLKMGLTDGGALWRMAQMLHQAYENLASRPQRARKNVLTDNNPDALLAGRTLTPGDVYHWLEQYKKEVKKGVGLERYLSRTLLEWLNTQFGSDKDAGDRRLYLTLMEKFNLVSKDAATQLYKPLNEKAIAPRILLERDVAMMSPRVPRPILEKEKDNTPPDPEALTKYIIDCTDEAGTAHTRVEVRIEEPAPALRGRYVQRGATEPVSVLMGTIRKCASKPELVDTMVLQEEDRPEKKIVVSNLDHFEKKELPHVLVVPDAQNPYHEALTAGGITDARFNPERVDRTIDFKKILEECVLLYQESGLLEWGRSVQGAELNNLTPDDRNDVEALVKEGWEVVGVMPGRDALVEEMRDAMKKLKPLWIKASKNESVDDGYIWPEYYNNLVDVLIPQVKQKTAAGQALSSDELLVRAWLESIPERAWLQIIKPTQAPENDTCSLDVKGQRAIFVSKQAAMPQVSVVNPAGYAVLQARFTRQVQEEAAKSGTPLSTLTGLDTVTWSRFIDLPLSSDGDVPGAGLYLNPGNRRVRFGGDVALNRSSRGGFRLEVRKEL